MSILNLAIENPWWKNAVIYEVYADKFAKNFKGFADKLGYLKDLGINCIWILPHYPSPMVDDGYDVSDYMSVRSELGTLGDFRRFASKAHKMGIKVIVDFVLNHVSISHPWFRERPEFFIRSKTAKEFKQATNPFSHMKSSNWIWDPETKDYYFASFYPQQADLNWDNPEVFKATIEVVDFWIGQGVDGFRLDAAPFLIKREGTGCVNLPETHAIIKKIRTHVESRNPQVILLAESNGTHEEIRSYLNGQECHMAFNFHLMAKIYFAIMTENPSVAKEAAKGLNDPPPDCQWAIFLRNHDDLTLSHLPVEERDELLARLDPKAKYLFEGGYGTSMRLATILKGNKNKILEAFRLLLSLSGAPVIYYGDEIGMENLELAEKPADSRKYVRGEFNWKEAEKQIKDPGSLLNELRTIIKNRKS